MLDGVLRRMVVELGVELDEPSVTTADRAIVDLTGGLGVLAGAATAAAAALVGMAMHAATAGDSAAKAAADIGISTEALTSMEHAAGAAGASTQGLRQGLVELARAGSEAAGGSNAAADALRSLGIDPAMGTAEDRLLALADAFQGLGEAEQQDLGRRLFRGASEDMVRLLRTGRGEIEALRREAEELGLIISDEQGAAAEAFTDALARAQGALAGISREVGFRLLPVLQPYLDAFTELVRVNREWISLQIERVVGVVSTALERAQDPIWMVVGALGALAAAWLAVSSPAVLTALAIGLIVLAVDDLIVAVRGGESAIGELFERFGAGSEFQAAMKEVRDLFAEVALGASELWAVLTGADLSGATGEIDILGASLRGIARSIQAIASGLRDTVALLRGFDGVGAQLRTLSALARGDVVGVGTEVFRRQFASTPSADAELAALTTTSPVAAGESNVTVTVNGAEGQSPAALADEVMQRLGLETSDAYGQAAGVPR